MEVAVGSTAVEILLPDSTMVFASLQHVVYLSIYFLETMSRRRCG